MHVLLQIPSECKVARKLVKTGAIRAIQSSIEKEKIKEEKINSGFKRSQVRVVSYVDPDAGNVVAYVAHFDHIRI
jgi:hypothetical protein